MGVRIRIARMATDLDRVFRLRHAVLVSDEGVLEARPDGCVVDRFDAFPECVRFVAETRDCVLGSARVTLRGPVGGPASGYPEFAGVLSEGAVPADLDRYVLAADARRDRHLADALLGMTAYWALQKGATHLCGLARTDVAAAFLEHGFERVAERTVDPVTGFDVEPCVLDLRARSDRFLALLERERIGAAFESFERQVHRSGDAVIRQGEPGDEAFVIVSGSVDVLISAHDDPIPIATLGPGDLFGELALLTDEPRAATVEARTDVVLMVLGRDAFERQLSESPKTAKRLIRLIGARMAGRATGSATRPVSGDVTTEL